MHPVIKNILARQNKKAPIADGRKIALVLFGGNMLGIRGGASVIALQELGLTYAFDDIYGVSAGFANASYFLAKQARTGTGMYYEDLKGKNFVNFFKLWKIVDIDFLISLMKFHPVKKLIFDRIYEGNTKLHARLYNVESKKDAYLEMHEVVQGEFMNLLTATISIPYFHPGSLKIGTGHYMDPNPFSNKVLVEHMQKVLASTATDILVIYNSIEQYKPIKKADLKTDKRIFEIIPDASWKMGNFCTDEGKLREAALQMGKLIKNTFGVNEGINLNYENRD